MSRLRLAFPAVVLSLVANSCGSWEEPPEGEEETRVMLLRVDDAESVNSLKSMIGAENIISTYQNVFPGFAARISSDELASLQANPAVVSIEEDTVVYPLDTQDLRATGDVCCYSWGLDLIDQAWDVPDRRYQYGGTGQGVDVFILDLGIERTHEQIRGRAYTVWDATPQAESVGSCSDHGTGVAGIAGGRDYGVAKQVWIWSLEVGCPDAHASTLVEALDWLLSEPRRRPRVLNISMASEPSTSLDEAVKKVIAAGITVVVGAGNKGGFVYESPARVEDAITVGAFTPDMQRWVEFSQSSAFGPAVDIWAPTKVRTAKSGGSSQIMGGTSAAAPHVTGVVARYLTAYPTASPAEVARFIRVYGLTAVKTGAPVPNETGRRLFIGGQNF